MIKRIIAGTLTAGLIGLTPLAVSAPAQATENLTTVTVAEPSTTGLVYGDDIYVSVDVDGSDGYGTSRGTTTLFAMEAGSSVWAPVATAQAGLTFYDVKPRMNTTYKVVYSGYTAASTYEDNYAASESAPFGVAVQRNVTIDNAKKRMTIKGKVKPDYKRSKVKVHIKVGKRWKKFKTIRTDRRSRFQVTLPAPRRGGKKLFFKITVPGSSQFLKYSEVWYTYTYRTAAPRLRVASSR